MNDETILDFRRIIEKSEAEKELQKLFSNEPNSSKTARNCLKDLLKYHLLQNKTDDSIEFKHQMIQEYYAAEYLLSEWNHIEDFELQKNYFNYLKWTEPLILAALLLTQEKDIVRLVRLALNVDLMLGARLAGEVKHKFQEKTAEQVLARKVPIYFQIELLKLINSQATTSTLLHLIDHEDHAVRSIASEILEKVVSKSEILKLINLLKHPESQVRWLVIKVLKKFDIEITISIFLKLLSDPDDFVRKNVADILGEYCAEEAVPGLLLLLNDSSSDVCESSAKALGKIGAEVAISALFDSLERTDNYCFDVFPKNPIVEALRQLCTETTIYKYLGLTEHSNPHVREGLAEVLGKFKGESVTNSLLSLAEDSNARVRCSVAHSLREISSKAMISRLLQMAEDPTPMVRSTVASLLGEIEIEEVAPTLLQLFQDSEYSEVASYRLIQMIENPVSLARSEGISSLGQIEIEEIMSTLLQLFQDPEYSVRESASEALRWITNRSIVPYLLNLLKYPKDRFPWFEVGKILGRSVSDSNLPELLNLLKHNDLRVRIITVRVLGEMRTESVIPELSKLV
jgi:HEAT repeat protein